VPHSGPVVKKGKGYLLTYEAAILGVPHCGPVEKKGKTIKWILGVPHSGPVEKKGKCLG
jgi:hypothetical protein